MYFVGCLLTAIAVLQNSPEIWASTALAAVAFFMVISLYLPAEQKKVRHKWLKGVGERLGHLGDDIGP